MPPTNEKSEYCNYEDNQFYVSQGQFCKQCNKCPVGLEKASYKDRKFDIHPVHGAEGCLHCIQCRNGFYSDSFSFEPCKPCTDCQKEGRYVEQNCSSFQNAVCGKFINKTTSPKINGSTNSDTVVIIGCLSGFIAVLICVLIAVVIYVFLRRRRKAKKRTVLELVESATTDTLISSSTSSAFGYTTDGSSDVETDGSKAPNHKLAIRTKVETRISAHDVKEEFSCKHANMISKNIAEKNYFHQIGIELGVSDEDIKIIKTDYKHSVHEQAYETLIKWKQLKGSQATVVRFLQILKTLELYSIAETFCAKYDAAAKENSKNMEA